MFDHLKNHLPEILPLVVGWGEEMEALICHTGRALSAEEIEMARSMDVREPKNIRILEVDEIPSPGHPLLVKLATEVGLLTAQSAGLTFGYGIFIREDHSELPGLRAHEFRHVAQYECFGSVAEFLRFYLQELLHFGYGPGPLENDASEAALKYL